MGCDVRLEIGCVAGAVPAGAPISKDGAFDTCQQVHLFGGQAGTQFGEVQQELQHVYERGRLGPLLPRGDRPLRHTDLRGKVHLRQSPVGARPADAVTERRLFGLHASSIGRRSDAVKVGGAY